MSTRSLIGIRKDVGITYVYCHFDGYLDGVGITLVKNYDTEDKVNDILKNGDMSSLGDSIDTCDFYNEPDSEAFTLTGHGEGLKDEYYKHGQNCWADYVYLFEDGKWYYARETVKRTEDGHGPVYDDKGEMVYAPADWKLVADGLRETEE